MFSHKSEIVVAFSLSFSGLKMCSLFIEEMPAIGVVAVIAVVVVIAVLKRNKDRIGAVVVANFVERSLPIPEVRCSNLVIGKKLYWTFNVNCIEKTKIMKKRPRLANFFKRPI